MNDLAAKRSSEPRAKDHNDDLSSLIGRMGDELTRLLDLRLNLLKVEIREDVDAYIYRGVVLAIGGVVVAVGFALLNIAISFFISTLFSNFQLSQPARYGLGFIVTGLVYLIAGGITIIVSKRRLAAQDLVPRRSLAEFENDKQLVRTVIQG